MVYFFIVEWWFRRFIDKTRVVSSRFRHGFVAVSSWLLPWCSRVHTHRHAHLQQTTEQINDQTNGRSNDWAAYYGNATCIHYGHSTFLCYNHSIHMHLQQRMKFLSGDSHAASPQHAIAMLKDSHKNEGAAGILRKPSTSPIMSVGQSEGKCMFANTLRAVCWQANPFWGHIISLALWGWRGLSACLDNTTRTTNWPLKKSTFGILEDPQMLRDRLSHSSFKGARWMTHPNQLWSGGQGRAAAKMILRLLCVWKLIRQRWYTFEQTLFHGCSVNHRLLKRLDLHKNCRINFHTHNTMRFMKLPRNHDETTTKPPRNHSSFIDKTTKPVNSIK